MFSLLTLSLTSIFVFLIILLSWLHWRYRALIRVASQLPNLPQYPALPLVGHAHYTIYGWEKVTEIFIDFVVKSVANGHRMICFWCGPIPWVASLTSGDIQKILNSSITAEKADEMAYVKYALGNGLLTAPYDTWKVTRRHINPLFHQKNLEQLIPTFNKNSRELVLMLSKHVGPTSFNVEENVLKISLKTVCHLIYGPEVEFEVESQAFDDLTYVIDRIFDLFTKRTVRLWLRFDSIFQLFYRKELKEINRKWKNFSEEPLKKTKENNAMKRERIKISTDGDSAKQDEKLTEGSLNLLNVFDILQESYPQFSEDDLKAEIITLYILGSESVASTVSCCLLALAQFQDIQDRVFREISSVMGQEDDVTLQDLDRMPYLDQVFKETLRWSTLVPFILRKTSDHLKLSTCTIPTGNTVVVGIMGLHMDPKIYPDPQKFNPEHFSKENRLDKDTYTFLPFSGGPRSCIGKKYAQYLFKIEVIHILRRFKLFTDMDIYKMRRKFNVGIVSAEGYYIRLQQRE